MVCMVESRGGCFWGSQPSPLSDGRWGGPGSSKAVGPPGSKVASLPPSSCSLFLHSSGLYFRRGGGAESPALGDGDDSDGWLFLFGMMRGLYFFFF